MRLWACLPLWTAEIKAPGNLEQSQSSKICPSCVQHSTETGHEAVLMTTVSEVNEKREAEREKQGQHQQLRLPKSIYLLYPQVELKEH